MLHPSISLLDDSKVHGKGLIATADIRKGEIVWQLDTDAQRLTLDDLTDWADDTILEFDYFAFQVGEDEYALPEGIDKYMNHSCDPNTWWGDDITLVARREIHPGEEVTYDYTTADISRKYYLACECGAATCRRAITNLDYLDPSWQEDYGRNSPSFVLQAIERVQSGRKHHFAKIALVLMREWFRLKILVRRQIYGTLLV